MANLLNIKDKIEPEKIIKIVPFKKDIRKTTAHKHNNYFEIIYLSQGSGTHYIDSTQFEITPPVMYFIRKEQVHFWELNTEPEGFVIIIKKPFIEKSLDDELKALFSRLGSQSCLLLQEHSTIQTIFELLCSESTQHDEGSLHIIEGLLKALLSKVLQIAAPAINEVELRSDLYQSFLALLQNSNVIKNSVQHYAKNLNTSPQNLNAACRKAVDQSATEVLEGFIINEAKRLLQYSSGTVSEIAYSLNFIDASHFVKYFKRVTGLTPQSFRQTPE
jgi:AraC family transcriptional activator of pobA